MSYLLRDGVSVVPDPGIFDASAGFRIPKEVTGGADCALHDETVRVTAAAPDAKPHRVHHGERASCDRFQLVADVRLFPVTNYVAPDPCVFVQDCCVDRFEF